MKKYAFPRRGARREEGMALLFALGFLALMLILGLGFVTTSLLAQKLAANNSGRAQARMFARSAAARAMLNIMLYSDQAILAGKTIENYDSIYSYDKVDYNDGPGNGSDHTVSDGELSDQLHKSSDTMIESKLKYQSGGDTLYSGEDSEAKWLFFYDSPTGTAGRRIIGRAAFQVLPRQAGQLSLYAVTGGSKVMNEYGAYPHTYRWGRDIAELDLENTQFDGGKKWYDEVKKDNIPSKYATLYNSYNKFFPSSDAENTAQKKRWIGYWFAEGKNPILKDAFPTKDPSDSTKNIYYNRFNISDRYYDASKRSGSTTYDNWYDRFRRKSGDTSGDGWSEVTPELKNSAEALEALTGKAVKYKDNHSTDLDVEPSGLPFLRRIGNVPWSFETLELLRRQIAANFNDYCDADSIPTSNIPAASWDYAADAANLPTYTGNERSLYINEVAVQIGKIGVHYTKADMGIGIKDDIDVKALVELVNMYDNSSTDGSALLDPANLEVKFKLEELSFKIALYGKYTGRITYTGSDGKTKTVNVNESNAIEVNKNYNEEKFRAEVKLDAGVAVDISGTGGGDGKFSTLENGYSVGRATVTAAVTNPEGSDFNAAVMTRAKELANADAANRGITCDTNTVKFQVRDVVAGYEIKLDDNSKIRLSPLMLVTNKAVTVDGSDVPAGTGLDFVRFDRVGAMTVSGSDLGRETGMRISSADAVKNKTYLIGGIEAKDPRQNLNPSSSGNSDWKLSPKFRPAAAIFADDSGVPTMTLTKVTTTGYDYEIDTSKACGKVNSDGNPSGRETEGAGDKETATDPAWLGETAGQHVSTAYIRNAPMVSPWEIGLIHRGREWQTLNLKRAGGFGAEAEIKLADIKSQYDNWTDPGTEYKNGDGAILEFIKVGVNCCCMGKIPLKLFKKANIGNGGDDVEGENKIKLKYNKDIIRMLFDGVRVGQTMKQFYAETYFAKTEQEENARQAQGGTAAPTGDSVITSFISEANDLCAQTGDNEFRMRSQFINSDYGAIGTGDNPTSFSFGLVTNADNDALREEVIGKTVNLLTVDEVTPPNVFRVVVVAQSIRDVGGIENDVTITKLHNGTKTSLSCQIGRFDFVSDSTDWENNTYFDEITGEVKALVTIERVPAADEAGEKNKNYGRMVVTGIEFID